MISISNVSKNYGKTVALSNVNIEINTGSIFGLVGINGAGKSTLLRMMAGVMKADTGCILYDGDDVFENVEVKRNIFFLPDDPYYTANVTAEKLRSMYSTFFEFDNALFNEFLSKFKLSLNKTIKNFSKGMKRQLYIALAIACRPKYLLLDEAFDGLDPLARLECKRALIELKENGTTVIISSHSLRELQDICDSYGLIDNKSCASSGMLSEELESVCKLQVVFAEPIDVKFIPFPTIMCTVSGRVVTIMAKGDVEELKQRLQILSPILVDELPLDFEEFFIAQVQQRGYLR